MDSRYPLCAFCVLTLFIDSHNLLYFVITSLKGTKHTRDKGICGGQN
jgi:hypothetical protein